MKEEKTEQYTIVIDIQICVLAPFVKEQVQTKVLDDIKKDLVTIGDKFNYN